MGLAIVERMAAEGHHVFMVDRDGATAAREASRLVSAGFSVEAKVLDLMDESASRQMIAQMPALQVLVNNAGIFDERGFFDVSSADFQRMFAVNMLAVATLTQEVAKKMLPGGRIVNIASRAYLGAKNHAHYVASKAAVVGYTRACAMELTAKDILVNAIAPGLIDTPLLQALTPERRAAQLALQPSGRAGTPQEIAEAVAFLASPKMGFITGQVLFVDGGKSLGGTYA